MRIILYLGKGGVGKTTISAATAVRSAALGKRTLVVSTDLAHSLADCFTTSLTSEPKELAPNLWAQEVNALDEMRHTWDKLQGKVGELLKQRGVNEVMAELYGIAFNGWVARQPAANRCDLSLTCLFV